MGVGTKVLGDDPERAATLLVPTACARTAAGSARRRRALPSGRWAGTGITSPLVGGASPSVASRVAAPAWCRWATTGSRARGLRRSAGWGEVTVRKPLNKQNMHSHQRQAERQPS